MDSSVIIVGIILAIAVIFAIYFALKYQKVKAELQLSDALGTITQEQAARELAQRQAIEAARARELRDAYNAALEAAKTKGAEAAAADLKNVLDKIRASRGKR